MKRIVVLTILITGLSFLSLNSALAVVQTVQKKPATNTVVVRYTCTMHPEIVKDKPGKCPKCGMALVELKSKPNRAIAKPVDKMPKGKTDTIRKKKAVVKSEAMKM